jgi:Na+/glutamate symporter
MNPDPGYSAEDLQKEKSQQEESVRDLITRQEGETRQALAKRFINYYFIILILVIVGVPIYNYLMYQVARQPDLIISIKDAILTYSAVTGSTFGLVVAYYFQSKKER